MTSSAAAVRMQTDNWRMLRGLHPTPIELERIALVRDRAPRELADAEQLARLLPALGLNDEGLHEFPAALHPHCGQGLRIWQYPIQFAPYLARLATLGVRSYLEIGIRHGGSFVATVEVLGRCHPLEAAWAIDIIPCPAMARYATLNPRASFACMNTRSPAFADWLAGLGRVDLVFVDSHHEEAQCRRELELVSAHADMIAMHDVANVDCPGIGKVWRELVADARYDCTTYDAQYEGLGPYMGIGLAIRKDRRADAARPARRPEEA